MIIILKAAFSLFAWTEASLLCGCQCKLYTYYVYGTEAALNFGGQSLQKAVCNVAGPNVA